MTHLPPLLGETPWTPGTLRLLQFGSCSTAAPRPGQPVSAQTYARLQAAGLMPELLPDWPGSAQSLEAARLDFEALDLESAREIGEELQVTASCYMQYSDVVVGLATGLFEQLDLASLKELWGQPEMERQQSLSLILEIWHAYSAVLSAQPEMRAQQASHLDPARPAPVLNGAQTQQLLQALRSLEGRPGSDQPSSDQPSSDQPSSDQSDSSELDRGTRAAEPGAAEALDPDDRNALTLWVVQWVHAAVRGLLDCSMNLIATKQLLHQDPKLDVLMGPLVRIEELHTSSEQGQLPRTLHQLACQAAAWGWTEDAAQLMQVPQAIMEADRETDEDERWSDDHVSGQDDGWGERFMAGLTDGLEGRGNDLTHTLHLEEAERIDEAMVRCHELMCAGRQVTRPAWVPLHWIPEVAQVDYDPPNHAPGAEPIARRTVRRWVNRLLHRAAARGENPFEQYRGWGFTLGLDETLTQDVSLMQAIRSAPGPLIDAEQAGKMALAYIAIEDGLRPGPARQLEELRAARQEANWKRAQNNNAGTHEYHASAGPAAPQGPAPEVIVRVPEAQGELARVLMGAAYQGEVRSSLPGRSMRSRPLDSLPHTLIRVLGGQISLSTRLEP